MNATELHRIYSYNEATGDLIRRSTGRPQCTLNRRGYYQSCVKRGLTSTVHRIAWIMQHGEPPVYQIDHINGDRLDNRIANLRDVTHGVNQMNKVKSHGVNSDLPVGIFRRVRSGRTYFRAVVYGKMDRLFLDLADAVAARLEVVNNLTEPR